MATALGIAFGIFVLGLAIYPTPVRWRRKPWFVKTDRQGRIVLAAFGGLWLVLTVGHAIS